MPWVLAFAIVGKQVGDNWDNLQEKLHYVDYAIVAAIVGGIVVPASSAGAGGSGPARSRADARPPRAGRAA